MVKFVFLAILACSAISVVLAKRHHIKFLEDLDQDARIIQGTPAAQNQFPHQALLEMTNASGNWIRCGGALISTRWVLTAAHCLRGQVSVLVRLGSVDYAKPQILIQGLKVFYAHENYNPTNAYNDVGVVNLGRDVAITVGLPSNVLNYVQLKVITNKLCIEEFGYRVIAASNICAVGIKSPAQGGCSGDSGSPLFLREADGIDTHIGVTSFVTGAGCEAFFPTGFARTSSYLDWISQKTGIAIRP